MLTLTFPCYTYSLMQASFWNGLCHRRSTTGIVLTYYGGTINYLSKTKTLNAESFTEAESIATVPTAIGQPY